MNKKHEEALNELYIELVKMQKEIIASGTRLLVILEGRDAAGKDGTIKAITLHLSPRETKVVALGKPSDREDHEWYFQRYTNNLPASGEMVLFNRSWYNRAGVEKVMGFCNEKEYDMFFNDVTLFEQLLVNAGIKIIKYYLDISKGEQKRRLEERETNPLKQWKISPIDKVAQKNWKAYSEARDKMLLKTNFKFAPWYIVDAEKKADAHIAIITHLLSRVEYPGKNKKLMDKENQLVYDATTEHVRDKLY